MLDMGFISWRDADSVVSNKLINKVKQTAPLPMHKNQVLEHIWYSAYFFSYISVQFAQSPLSEGLQYLNHNWVHICFILLDCEVYGSFGSCNFDISFFLNGATNEVQNHRLPFHVHYSMTQIQEPQIVFQCFGVFLSSTTSLHLTWPLHIQWSIWQTPTC